MAPIRKIISGGQTGVDRGALDAAIASGVPHGGWCPRGRTAEDGPIPPAYRLRETESPDYAVRTRQNVIDSDGTLVVHRGPLGGGTKLTVRLAEALDKPVLVVDLDQGDPLPEIRRWLAGWQVAVLNVAGPRESGAPGIAHETDQLLQRLLADG